MIRRSPHPIRRPGRALRAPWIAIAVPIVGRISVEPGFEVKTLPAGKMVTLIYTGPYHEVGGAYTKALEYVGSHGLKMNGLCREMYLNNPQEVPESKLMTEIQIPVA